MTSAAHPQTQTLHGLVTSAAAHPQTQTLHALVTSAAYPQTQTLHAQTWLTLCRPMKIELTSVGVKMFPYSSMI